MIKIKLKHTQQITDLFNLLSISDPGIKKMYYSLLSICALKDNAIQNEDYNEAAKLRRKELDTIRKILKSLNTKGILEKNQLKINFVAPAD